MPAYRYLSYIIGGICFMGIFYLSYSTMHKLNETLDGLNYLNQKIADQRGILNHLSVLEEAGRMGESTPRAFDSPIQNLKPLDYENAPPILFNDTSFRNVIVQHSQLNEALNLITKQENVVSTLSPALITSRSVLSELINTREYITLEMKGSLSTFVWLSGLILCLAAVLVGLPFAAQHRVALKQSRETNKRLQLKTQELSATHNTMGNMLEDIIYQRRQATRTEENNARLASIINSTDDPILSLNMTGVIVTANPASEKLFGDNLIGRRFHQLFGSDIADQVRAMVLTTQERNCGSTFDVHIHRDSQRIDLSLTVSPIRAEQNALVGFSVIAKSISGMMQEQEKFRLAVEASPNPMIMVNHHGHIVLANSRMEKLFGFKKEELYGQPVHILVPSSQRKKHVEHVLDYLKNPQSRSLFDKAFKLHGQKKDESRFPVEISLTPIEMASETFVICSIIDVSDRLSHQSELQTLNKELSRKNNELEQFIYAVSHDLKAPLVTISGFTQRLIEDPALKDCEKQLHKLHRILNNAHAMETLLQDLLDLSRVIKRDLAKTQLNTEIVLNQVIESMETQIRSTSTTIHMMPPFYPIYAQESLLKQCLQNIIGNAIKYRKPDVKPTIRVMPFANPSYTGLIIEDNGIGIPEDHQTRIFTVFERLQPQLCDGTGVGLTIVKTIMEKHDGKIFVDSEEGQGSKFTLMFPKESVQDSDV